MEVVGETERGGEVIQKARELRPDVVVLDITMPDLNGLDLIVLLRRASRSSSKQRCKARSSSTRWSPTSSRSAISAICRP
jgi:two-component system chemotaxis response regulator CheY